MIGTFSDLTMQAVERGLSGAAFRQRIAAHNVANVGTPGFRAQRVDFEASLARALQTGGPVRYSVVPTPTIPNQSGNTVSLEAETQTLIKSDLYYEALTKAASYKLGVVNAAVTGVK